MPTRVPRDGLIYPTLTLIMDSCNHKSTNEKLEDKILEDKARIQLAKAIRPRGYKTLFMLNSTEHTIYHAHEC